MGSFPDIFTAIIPSKLADIFHDMERLSLPTTDFLHTTSVFAILRLHIFVNVIDYYCTSDRTRTTTTVTTTYSSYTKTVKNDIMHFNASSTLLSSRPAGPDFHLFVHVWRARVTGTCVVCCEICLGTTFFAKVTHLNSRNNTGLSYLSLLDSQHFRMAV